jgi:hypothetical protein
MNKPPSKARALLKKLVDENPSLGEEELRNGNFFKELRGRKDWDEVDRALLEELFEVWFEDVWGQRATKGTLSDPQGRLVRPALRDGQRYAARSSRAPSNMVMDTTCHPFCGDYPRRKTPHHAILATFGALTGFLGAGSFGAGSCCGTTAGFGITSGMSTGCEPGW